MSRGAKEPSLLDRALARIFSGEMERHGYTYEQLAELTGLSRARVNRLLTGKRPFYVTDVATLTEAFDLEDVNVMMRAQEHVRLAEEMGGEL